MSREYVEITSVIGMRLKDRLRAIEWEPIPERLAYLLAKLQQQCTENSRTLTVPTKRGTLMRLIK
jgi:hypothetical protein